LERLKESDKRRKRGTEKEMHIKEEKVGKK
jgi:hypothetical protein